LGIGDWAQSPIPNPQSPIPNNYENIKNNNLFLLNHELKNKKYLKIKYNFYI